MKWSANDARLAGKDVGRRLPGDPGAGRRAGSAGELGEPSQGQPLQRLPQGLPPVAGVPALLQQLQHALPQLAERLEHHGGVAGDGGC